MTNLIAPKRLIEPGFSRCGISSFRRFRLLLCAWCWLFTAAPVALQAQAVDSFYSGKTLQFIVSSGRGVTTDVAARLVARYLGKHVPGNPTIIARNMPGAGGLVAANYLY